MPALLISAAEVAEVQRRLVERDPTLDLPRVTPRIIAALYDREAEVQTSRSELAAARAEIAEITRRYEAVYVEISRRDAVVDAARRLLGELAEAAMPLEDVLSQYDRGNVVII